MTFIYIICEELYPKRYTQTVLDAIQQFVSEVKAENIKESS